MITNLVLIRGLPGSGKSTLARDLAEFHEKIGDPSLHIEADMFFMEEGKHGMKYVFDASQLHNAHKWCQDEVKARLEWFDTLLRTNNNEYQQAYIYVSNTFTTLKEMKPYFEMADKFHISPQVILCQGFYGSEHDVPLETMKKMKERFVYNINSLYTGVI